MTTDITQFRSKALVLAVVAALLAWSLGLPNWIHTAQAAALIEVSDTLSDSDLGVAATHTIQFELGTEMNGGETMVITFDPNTDAFDLSGLTTADADVTALSGGTLTEVDAVGDCTAPVTDQVYFSAVDTTAPGESLTMTVCSGDTVATGTVMEVVVGPITNPSTVDSYVIEVAGTNENSGDTRVAIIDDVTVTAEVQTILDFTIVGVASGTTVNSEPVATFASTTATSIPFDILSPDVPKFLAQELRIDTNALNGFTVTVEADQTLTAGNSADIDTFVDGGDQATGLAWTNPSNSFGTENTYGHWGLTSDDDDVGTALDFGVGTTSYVGSFVGNPVEVFYHDEAVSYTTAPTSGESFTQVGYKAEIGTLQEAADDYTATLTYVATPVF
ncbi:hypothetical protein GVX82_00040 [Patescibacteria group bacterium]|jgi:hypothetical protein|nr:hypothetical protein [Patescibacteria group bacterium]